MQLRRYYAIVAPLHYTTLVSSRRVIIGLAVSWTGTLLLCLPPLVGLVPPYKFVYTYYAINHHYYYHHHRRHNTADVLFYVSQRRVACASTVIVYRNCCIRSYNERDSIYFVFSLTSRKLFCLA